MSRRGFNWRLELAMRKPKRDTVFFLIAILIAAGGAVLTGKAAGVYWGATSLLAAVGLILILTPRIRHSLVHFICPGGVIRRFDQYCIHCTEMLLATRADGYILTIQTPAADANTGGQPAYAKYINTTVREIVARSSKGFRYHRLVAIKDPEDPIVQNVKNFLHRLADEAMNAQYRENVNVLLTNVRIGFVKHEVFARWLIPNLDVHIASPHDFTIAFAADDQGTLVFGGAIRIHDRDQSVCMNITNNVEREWGDAETIHVDKIIKPGVIGNDSGRRDIVRDQLNNAIDVTIDQATAKLFA